MTLLVQGLTLPAVLRWARLPDDGAEAAEQQLAERAATEAGLAALPVVATRLGVTPDVADRVRNEYLEHLHALADATDEDDNDRAEHDDYRRLLAALIPEERAAVVRLCDRRQIDDIVLRRLQARLDAKEVRLTPSSTADD